MVIVLGMRPILKVEESHGKGKSKRKQRGGRGDPDSEKMILKL